MKMVFTLEPFKRQRLYWQPMTSAMLTNRILFSYNETMKEKKNASNEQLNILQVHNFYRQTGGEDVVVMREADLLKDHGHEVVQYFRHNREIDDFSLSRKLMLPINSVFSFRTYRQVRNLIREKKIDLVHVHNTLHLISPAVFWAAKKEGVPVVMTVHNYRLLCPAGTFYNHGHICEKCMKKGLIQSVRYCCYRGSRLQTAVTAATIGIHRRLHTYRDVNFICLTDFQKEKLLALTDVTDGHIFIKPNAAVGDDTAHSDTVRLQKKEEKKPDRQNEILYAGRLEEDKGILDLLRAYRFMKKDMEAQGYTVPKLTICGEGSLLFRCRRYAEVHNLKNVEFTGHIPQEKVSEKMTEVRCIVIPSRWYEGMPMVLTEAYRTKTPVVVPDFGCFSTLVTDGVNGFKYRAHDKKELASLLGMISAKPWEMTCSFSEREILKQTEAEANYQQLINIYERCIQYVRNHKKK